MKKINRLFITIFILLMLVLSFFLCFPYNAKAQKEDKIPIIYFYTEGCNECKAVEEFLKLNEKDLNFYIFKQYEVLDKEGRRVRSYLDEIYSVPKEKRGVAPTIFIGKNVLVREPEIKGEFKNLTLTLKKEDSEYLLKQFNNALKSEDNKTVELFKSFGVLTIMMAGLIDGVNPCAFAILIFFISYLIFREKTRREILQVGLVFALGVFIAYFVAGIGVYQLVSEAKWFFSLSKWFYLLIAIFTFVLGVFTIVDVKKIKKGKEKEMTLKLPDNQKNRIHKLIRDTTKTSNIMLGAFLIAFPISFFEFLCTGQTYLPTIIFIYSQNIFRERALLFLIFYNLMFITPLLLITFIAYFGVSSVKISNWFSKNLVKIKFATALLFFVFSIYLLSRSLLLFGILR